MAKFPGLRPCGTQKKRLKTVMEALRSCFYTDLHRVYLNLDNYIVIKLFILNSKTMTKTSTFLPSKMHLKITGFLPNNNKLKKKKNSQAACFRLKFLKDPQLHLSNSVCPGDQSVGMWESPTAPSLTRQCLHTLWRIFAEWMYCEEKQSRPSG